MAVWHVGIDESGCFNHLDPEDKSFVCAVATKESHGNIMKVFSGICKELQLPIAQNASDQTVLEQFHGCKQGRRREAILKRLQKYKDSLFPRVIVCRGTPYVAVNPQQWWISSILGAIERLFVKDSSSSLQKGDKIKISIANRNGQCLGLLGKNPSKGILDKYNDVLRSSIEKEVRKKHRNFDIDIDLCSAQFKALPALADQVATMVRLGAYNEIELAKPLNLSLGNGKDVETRLENDDFLGATEILLSNIFSGDYTDVSVLNKILMKADVKVWALIIRSVETTLLNRGVDGNAVNHIAKIMPILLNNKKNIPDSSLLIRFFKTYSNFVGDAGRAEDNTFAEIKELLNEKTDLFVSRYEKWHFYVELLAAEAEVKFNAYDFVFPDLAALVDYQERIKKSYPSLDSLDNRADDVGSQIYGMLGEQAAFQNRIDESIAFFEKDFDCATNDYYKAMVASFLVVNYHRKKDLENAQKWLSAQSEHIKNKNDQWLVVNQLRVGALAAELGEKWNGESLLKNIQSWHNEGDYPWPMLLKWKAFIEYKKGNVEPAIKNLNQAFEKLKNSEGFTISTLALSVAAMCIAIYGMENNQADKEKWQGEYTNLLTECVKKVQSFDKYVGEHPEFAKANVGNLSLWEAATLLPFNYS